MEIPNKLSGSALVHFSGGCDSTLTAAFYAERFAKVYLVTYDRFSFVGAKNYTKINFEKLCGIYGEDKFVRIIHPIGKLHKKICYNNYLYFVRKYKLAITGLSFSKLSMHWQSAILCLENDIKFVADGAVPYMDLYLDQNKKISIQRLVEFYKTFGITYENPVYNISENVEQMLYDKGITDTPNIRGTKDDKQIFYVEQVVFALFVKYYIQRHGRERYESIMSSLYNEKIQYMEQEIKKYLKSR